MTPSRRTWPRSTPAVRATLFSALIVATLATGPSIGTQAAFSDFEVITGNTVGAGVWDPDPLTISCVDEPVDLTVHTSTGVEGCAEGEPQLEQLQIEQQSLLPDMGTTTSGAESTPQSVPRLAPPPIPAVEVPAPPAPPTSSSGGQAEVLELDPSVSGSPLTDLGGVGEIAPQSGDAS